jgi:hypothetical protein
MRKKPASCISAMVSAETSRWATHCCRARAFSRDHRTGSGDQFLGVGMRSSSVTTRCGGSHSPKLLFIDSLETETIGFVNFFIV